MVEIEPKVVDINNRRVHGKTWNAKQPKTVGRSLGQSTDGRKLGVGILEFLLCERQACSEKFSLVI